MTRKQALQLALEALSENSEANIKLRELLEEYPLNHWTDKAIRDRVEQWIYDNGKIPTATDFLEKSMPPHTVIKLRYGITLSEWLRINYANKKAKSLKEQAREFFICEYNAIKPSSYQQFVKQKTKGKFSMPTLKRILEVKTWAEMKKVCGVCEVHNETKVKRKFFVTVEDGLLEKYIKK